MILIVRELLSSITGDVEKSRPMERRSSHYPTVWACSLLLTCLYGGSRLAAQEGSAGQRQLHRTPHFSLYTDLPADEARALLERLEATVQTLADYWRRPLRGTIQCYVARDVDAWHDRELPHPMARILIGRVGGAALYRASENGGSAPSKIVVLASAKPGVAEHEVVHAYCGQTFGTTGPLWYREGMAQLLVTNRDVSRGMDFPAETFAALAAGPKLTLSDVVGGTQNTQELCASFDEMIADHDGVVGLIPVSDWSEADSQSLAAITQTYAWSWLVCHMLEFNPNYRARFRALGQDCLSDQEEAFGRRFDAVAKELMFEYEFTVARMAPGYRVDLCAWDWDKRCRPLNGPRPARMRVHAARGYQASGLTLVAGQAYSYRVTGTWLADPQAGPVGADGAVCGNGRLEAVVLRDFQLSEPVLLGECGSFASPCDGQLYLRCHDAWNQLSDNSGSVVVTLSPGH